MLTKKQYHSLEKIDGGERSGERRCVELKATLILMDLNKSE